MPDPFTNRTFHDLVIEADSPDAEIWIIDNAGHPVQREVGLLETGLIPGEYYVQFSGEKQVYRIALRQASRFTEAELKETPAFPIPVPKFDDD